MRSTEVLTDAFERIRGVVHRAAEGLDADALAFRPEPDANSIAWLVWHLTRIQDDHVSEIAGREQAWTGDGWVERLGLPFDRADTGFGHSSDQVGAVQPASPEPLLGYHDAVHRRTLETLEQLGDGDLDRIIDESWDPPVSVGVRLVSVVGDNLQHAGQARYVRGIIERRSGD